MHSVFFTEKLHTHSLRFGSANLTARQQVASTRSTWHKRTRKRLGNISRHSSIILHYCTCDFPESNARSSWIVRSKRLEADLVGGTDEREEKKKNKQCCVCSMRARIFVRCVVYAERPTSHRLKLSIRAPRIYRETLELVTDDTSFGERFLRFFLSSAGNY